MKIAGHLLLISGWTIVLTAIIVLAPGAMLGGFVIAGVGVEILGLALLVHAHRHLARTRGER